MSLTLTQNATNAASGINIQPQLVFKIDGVDTLYGAVEITSVIRIGDPGLLIGDDWVIGGRAPVDNQEDYISLDGTTTSIKQQLNQDTAIGSSISSMQIALIDKNSEITELISPSLVLDDVLGRKCKVYLGFKDTNFPEDYVTIFRGIIDEVQALPGKIVFNIAHPDQKKRQKIFNKVETTLNGGINNSATTITVESTDNFLAPVNGPNGANDTSLKFYIRIDDEIIRYTGTTPTTFTGCTRAQLGTTAASHSSGANADSFYRLTGNVIDLSLKLMLSGWNGYYATGVSVESFNFVSAIDTVENAIFFLGVNVSDEYGIFAGDYITTVSATEAANNVTLKPIISVNVTEEGSYIVVDDVTFDNETESPATISFRSQYDVLGEGLGLSPDEVDVAEHIRIQRLFLSDFDYDFYFKDTIDSKEFIERELYNPASAYALPRKARASIGYHIGPVPGANIQKLSEDNITNAKNLVLKRSTTKNFFNTIVYRYEDYALEDKFLDGHIETDATSKTRIPVGNKTLTIDASGLRTNLSGRDLAHSAAVRRLNRYKFAAQYIDQIEVLFRVGFNVEVGDVVLLDAEGLFLSNLVTGDRTSENIKLVEVVSKEIDIKSGKVRLSVVDTNFSTSARYGLISPSSYIKAGISQTQFIIKSSFSSVFGPDEFRKWNRFLNPGIKVRNSDFSVTATSVIDNIVGNTVTLTTALGFVPSANYIMEFADYDDCTTEQKLVYAFMRDSAFSDGKNQYVML